MNLPTVEEILREKIHEALPYLTDGERAKFDRITFEIPVHLADNQTLIGLYNLIRRTLLSK